MGTFNLDMGLFKPEMGTFKIVMDRINFFSFRLFIVCERSVRNPIVFFKKKICLMLFQKTVCSVKQTTAFKNHLEKSYVLVKKDGLSSSLQGF